ncbi:hypothetical protein FQA39_LY17230 [Lamprigera yunnana]|nr:hypothetical protein FQA39_LY17230 [Lamprigera yunnana]
MDGTLENNEEDPIADRSQEKSANKRKADAVTGDEDLFVTALNRSIETRERRDHDDNDEDRLFLLSLLSILRDNNILRFNTKYNFPGIIEAIHCANVAIVAPNAEDPI